MNSSRTNKRKVPVRLRKKVLGVFRTIYKNVIVYRKLNNTPRFKVPIKIVFE